MEIYFCRICNLISLFFVIYFIQMVVEPTHAITRNECLASIHEVFRVQLQRDQPPRDTYFQYAFMHLRYLKDDEKEAYHNIINSQNLGPEPVEMSEFLLYDGNNEIGNVVENECAFIYYQSIRNKFYGTVGMFPGEDGYPRPAKYCQLFEDPQANADCAYSLHYFGIEGKTWRFIKYGYLTKVLLDITSRIFDDFIIFPPKKEYAQYYFIGLARSIRTRYNMLLPYDFCSRNYR